MFFINYKVTISDINYGGHMGNERALILFQQVRIDLLKTLGLDEVNVGNNVGTIQKDAHINYKSEVFLGEELKVIIKNIEIKKTSLNYMYSVEKSNGQIALEGSTLVVAFSYQNKKITKFPLEFLKKLELELK